MQWVVSAVVTLIFAAGCKVGMDRPPTPTPTTVEAWQQTLSPRDWGSGTQELVVIFDASGQIHIARDGPHMDDRYVATMGGIRDVTLQAFACLGGKGDATWYVDQLSDGTFVLRLARSSQTLEYRMTWSSDEGPLDRLTLDGNQCHLVLTSGKRR